MIEKKSLRLPNGELIETYGKTKNVVQKAYASSMGKETPKLKHWKGIPCEIDLRQGSFQKHTRI